MPPIDRTTPARGLRFCAGIAAVVAAMALLPGTTAATTQWAGIAADSATAAAEFRPAPAGSYLVRAEPGQLPAVKTLIARHGPRPTRELRIINAVAVTLPAGEARALRADPRVLSVTPDAPVRLLSSTYVPGQDVNSQYSLGQMVGSRGWWNKYTGAGVDVALVDSGVTPVVGLADPGKIVNGPDLTPESQNPGTRSLDTYGHGTFLAGIIAGHDPGINPATNQGNSTVFLGVAPAARIVSVKVADAHGNSDVSQVIAGIDWVVQHAHDPGLNIRVLNLSFGTNSSQAYTLDPLAYAVEVAWRAGVAVVTSAGNSGASSGRLTDPALDPYVIAVGADDLNGTPSITDDTIPAFSSRGDGIRNPDLVAPGAHLQSLRVPGSYIDNTYASTGAIDARFFRGSGTSQAAAFISGCLALVMQKYPTLTPDQAKALLTRTASPLKAADPQAQGTGLVNMRNVAGAQPAATTQTWTPSTGTGTLEGARGDAHLSLDGVTLTGETDINGQPFNATAMAAAEASGTSWTGGTWNGSTWTGRTWTGGSWDTATWTGRTWTGASWSGRTWTTGTWAGTAWTASNWSTGTWTGATWTGRTWTGRTWTDDSWS